MVQLVFFLKYKEKMSKGAKRMWKFAFYSLCFGKYYYTQILKCEQCIVALANLVQLNLNMHMGGVRG